jgi:DNA-binding transcriptional LysR family regulator
MLVMENVQTAVVQIVTQVVQPNAQLGTRPALQLVASDARLFLQAAGCNSLREAAKVARCSLNTMRAHIARLEDMLGTEVFYRSARGIKLTEAGRQLILEIGQFNRETELLIPRDSPKQANTLRLAVTEGLGAFWIVPRLAELQKEYPELTISLDCKMEVEQFTDQNIDIAVQLERPSDPNLMCVKLGTMHVMPFASHEYLREYGKPTTLTEGFGHRVVMQQADQVRFDVLSALAGEEAQARMVKMTTNTSSAHYWAVARGVGIGMLPTYARAITKRIVPLDIEIKLRRDIWLIYHPRVKRFKMGHKAIEFLIQSFDHIRYPWFADEFIHPSEFEMRFQGGNVVRLFAGFMDASDDEYET